MYNFMYKIEVFSVFLLVFVTVSLRGLFFSKNHLHLLTERSAY